MSARRPTGLTPRVVFGDATFYPLTVLYVGAVALILLVTRGTIPVPAAVILLGLLAALLMLTNVVRVLRKIAAEQAELQAAQTAIHRLVDGNRVELLARVDQLSGLLANRGVQVPPAAPEVQRTRREVAAATKEQYAQDLQAADGGDD